eukprot:6568816-Heterocapsa_arctica.AAC.2
MRDSRDEHKFIDERPHRQTESNEVAEKTFLWRHTSMKGGRKAGTRHICALGTRGRTLCGPNTTSMRMLEATNHQRWSVDHKFGGPEESTPMSVYMSNLEGQKDLWSCTLGSCAWLKTGEKSRRLHRAPRTAYMGELYGLDKARAVNRKQ